MGYTIIILIIYAAAHIIAAIAKKSAERKEQERIRAEMERRRGGGQAPAMNQPGPSNPAPQESRVSIEPVWGNPGGPANPLPTSVRTSKPVDELAERRKQQLEQLRLRREAGRGTIRTAQTRVASPPTQRTQAATTTLDPGIQAEVQRRQREKAEVRRAQQAQEAQRREVEKRTRRDNARKDQSRREQVKPTPQWDELHRPTPVIAQSQTSPTQRAYAQGPRVKSHQMTRALQSRLRDPGALQELFILKELLDPPVSLRSENAA
jgi:hypothetical protein